MYFEHAIDEVHNPVVLDPRPRVKAALVLPVEMKARIRNLDGEHRALRVRVAIAAGRPGTTAKSGSGSDSSSSDTGSWVLTIQPEGRTALSAYSAVLTAEL